MKFQSLTGLGIAVALVVSYHAEAVEPLLAQELADHCIAYPQAVESADSQYCIRYIQGFIDGAIATDERVLINIEAEYERKETYTERAMRTRSPAWELRDRAARYAEFCLGEPVSLREVVDRVVADLRARKLIAEGALASTEVYASLRTHYPCKNDPYADR
jgi:hypothetical protein